MKKLFLIASLLFATLISVAQGGSWTIRLGNKTLISTNKENDSIHTRQISRSALTKTSLHIKFKEDSPDAWMRSFLFFDENDNQFLTIDSTTSTSIKGSKLNQLFAGKKEIWIYTIVSPTDPNLAVRMRRVHLCTLRF